jgi:hypothetical protein
MTTKNRKIFYPVLLGTYAAVGLVGANIQQMELLEGVRAILVAVLFSVATYALFSWRVRDQDKAALMCAIFFLFFFSYGHVYDAMEGWSPFGIVLGRHRFLFPIWVLAAGASLRVIYKKARKLRTTTQVLNIVSVILLALPSIQIASFEWQRNRPQQENILTDVSLQTGAAVKNLPDVYYIILDGYARDDMLLQNYGLDISDFIARLEEIGFYVPRCSQSNYAMTALSLASALNMNTVDQILPQAVRQNANIVAFNDTIVHNLVRQNLESMGYQTVSFQNDIWWTEWSDSDHFIKLESKPYDVITDFGQISRFEVLFLRTTALRILEEATNKWLAPLLPVKTPEEHQAELILLALDGLQIAPEIQSPKFVFAHIIAPHEPYVFSPDGEFVYTQAADPGYPNQIQYLNKRLVPIVKNIIEQSEVPPIIILQSDHGRDPEVRLANFIAIYFPGEGAASLYPTLTPINIFRLMFNNYFGQKLPLLPDTSYDSFYDKPYEFTEVVYPCDPER